MVRPRPAAAAVFFLHGLGALVLESVWVKAQVALFGSVPAAPGSVLLACFVGIAAGSWLWRGKGPAALASPRFVALTVAALAISLALPSLLLREMARLGGYAGGALISAPALWLVAFAAVLPAGVVLGAFFPALGNAVEGRGFIVLYAMESAGAALGVGLGAFLLPPAIGYLATGAVGAAAVLLGLLLVRRMPPGIAVAPEGRLGAPVPPRWLVAAFASGLLSLTLEALWIRLVALASDDSVYAFGSVTLLVILLLSAASLVVGILPGRLVRAPRLQVALLLLTVAGGLAAAEVWLGLTHGLRIRLVTEALGFAKAFALAAPLVVTGSLFASFIFPVVLRGVGGRAFPEGSIGTLLAANSAGAAAGVALASFLLLPKAGIWGTLVMTLTGYLLLLPVIPAGRSRWAAGAGGAILLLAVNPLRYPLVTPSDPSTRVVSVREGMHGIVSVLDYPGSERLLWLNNTYLLEGYKGDTGGTTRLGILPTALHPLARRAAMIGVGTGISASGLLEAPLEEVLLVELIPEVADAAATHFAGFNRNALADRRVRLLIDDGRHALAASRTRFDIVCIDLVTPWNEGASALYTLEHFRTVRSRLAPGGIFVVWLPLFQLDRDEFLLIARTLAEVFPAVGLWQGGYNSENAELALVASAEPLDVAAIAAGASGRFPTGAAPDPMRIHVSGVLSRYVGPVDLGDALWSGRPLITLDRPRLEFMAARGGRRLLRGRPFLELLEAFFRQPANPGGRFFTAWGPEAEAWRTVGRDTNLYGWYLKNNDVGRARALEARIAALPAFNEGTGR